MKCEKNDQCLCDRMCTCRDGKLISGSVGQEYKIAVCAHQSRNFRTCVARLAAQLAIKRQTGQKITAAGGRATSPNGWDVFQYNKKLRSRCVPTWSINRGSQEFAGGRRCRKMRRKIVSEQKILTTPLRYFCMCGIFKYASTDVTSSAKVMSHPAWWPIRFFTWCVH